MGCLQMSELPSLELVEFSDLDLVQQGFQNWHLEAVQIDPGTTKSLCYNLSFDDFVVTLSYESHTSMTDYLIPQDFTLLAFLNVSSGPVKWCGLGVSAEVLLINPSGRDYFAVVPAGYDAALLVLSNKLIAELDLLPDELMHGRDLLKAWMVPLGPVGTRLQRWLFRLLHSIEALRHLAQDPLAATRFRDDLLGALSLTLDEGLDRSAGSVGKRRLNRYRMARRAHEVIEAKFAEIHSTQHLARELGISARVLQYLFRDMFHAAPHQYIMKRKLQAIRTKLRDRPASQRSVSQIAIEYGFSEFGRFSGRYRQQFGEVPSATRAHR